jgi:hypothetical protein
MGFSFGVAALSFNLIYDPIDTYMLYTANTRHETIGDLITAGPESAAATLR